MISCIHLTIKIILMIEWIQLTPEKSQNNFAKIKTKEHGEYLYNHYLNRVKIRCANHQEKQGLVFQNRSLFP